METSQTAELSKSNTGDGIQCQGRENFGFLKWTAPCIVPKGSGKNKVIN